MKRQIFALPKIVRYQNKSGLQYFLFSTFYSNQPKKRGTESRMLKNPLSVFAQNISFIESGINETKTSSAENLKRIGWAGDFI